MKRKILEEPREIEIKGEYDVIVVGGGPAGITASISSARSKMRTLLIERYGFLGGMATAGMVGSFCGFFTTGQKKKPIVGGLAEEIIKSLKLNNGISEKRVSKVNPMIGVYSFNPEIFKYVAEKLVIDSGADILYHTFVVDIIWEIKGKRLLGLIAENKSGRIGFLGKMIIDSTGDGDIAFRAGVPYELGNQALTTIFRLSNVDQNIIKEINLKEIEKMLKEAKDTGKYKINRIDGIINPALPQGITSVNITNIIDLDATDTWDLTKAEIEGRFQVFEYLRAFRDILPGFENAEISSIASQVGVRETRRILGEYLLKEEEVLKGEKPDNLIALGGWPVEIHDPETHSINWKFLEREDDYYGIPAGCLIPKLIDNLIIAGRCISTTHVAQASTRVIGQAFALGEAAGLIASESILSKTNPREIKINKIQKELISRGAILEA